MAQRSCGSRRIAFIAIYRRGDAIRLRTRIVGPGAHRLEIVQPRLVHASLSPAAAWRSMKPKAGHVLRRGPAYLRRVPGSRCRISPAHLSCPPFEIEPLYGPLPMRKAVGLIR